MPRILYNLITDDRGGEVIEYALILGFIVVATIAAIAAMGSKVLARWNSVSGASL